MKILVFSELFYPHGGGAELATWLYTKMLSEIEGVKLTVVTRRFPGELQIERINRNLVIYRIPLAAVGGRYDTLINVGRILSSSMLKKLRESDVIYIPGEWYSMIPIAKAFRKPVVVHLHNYSVVCSTSLMYDFVEQKVDPSSLKSFILHELIEKKRKPHVVIVSSVMNELLGKHYNRLGVLADALIFVSNAQMNLVLSKVPNIRRKSYVIYNPIPNDPLIRAEKMGIGYFGGRRFVKGFHILMRALKSLKHSSNIEVYMTMTSEKHKIIKLNNGIVINLLPKLNRNSFLDLMKKLSIVVIPSLWPEPLPYTLAESMLYGKLVIVSKIGGIPEMVDETSLGLKLIRAGDYRELTDGLTSFLSFKLEQANEVGFKNREYLLQKFDNERTIKSFIDILNSIST